MVAKRTQLCCTQQSLVKFSEMFSSFGQGFSFPKFLHLTESRHQVASDRGWLLRATS